MLRQHFQYACAKLAQLSAEWFVSKAAARHQTLMPTYLRTQLRNMFPVRYQVPAKFWYGWACRKLEPELQILDELIKPGETAIDVGANRGIYAYRLWRMGCRVEMFEPNPICCAVLLAWSEQMPNLRLHEVALSSRCGEASLHIPVDEKGVEHDASASLEQGHFKNARHQAVRLTTLDGYGFNGVELIKIDVEGHEQRVLEGSGDTIARTKPALLIEIEQRHNSQPIENVFHSIARHGYQGFVLQSGRLRRLEQFRADVNQALEAFHKGSHRYINNFIFLHRDRILSGRYDALVEPTE